MYLLTRTLQVSLLQLFNPSQETLDVTIIANNFLSVDISLSVYHQLLAIRDFVVQALCVHFHIMSVTLLQKGALVARGQQSYADLTYCRAKRYHQRGLRVYTQSAHVHAHVDAIVDPHAIVRFDHGVCNISAW